MERQYYYDLYLSNDSDNPHPYEKGNKVNKDVANLVSSELVGSKKHLPVLDFDFPCKLVESSTCGHYHLYIDTPISWKHYKNILTALHDADLINDFWYESSMKRGATFVRPEGVHK